MSQGQIVDLLFRYFNAYGYYIIFFLLLLENFFIIGLVVPGETVLLLGAFAASQGTLNIVSVIFTAIIAAVIGNIVGYFVGRRGGRPLIEKYGGRFVSEERISAAERYFDVHGTKTVFIGRFAAGVRVFIPLLAGASRMPFVKFILYTVAAVISWTIGLGLVGYFFGQNWPFISKLLSRFSFVVLGLLIAFIVYYVVRRRKREAATGRGDHRNGA